MPFGGRLCDVRAGLVERVDLSTLGERAQNLVQAGRRRCGNGPLRFQRSGLHPSADRVQVVQALRLIEQQHRVGVDHSHQVVVSLHLAQFRRSVHLDEHRRPRAEINLRHIVPDLHGLLRRALGLRDGEFGLKVPVGEVGHLRWRNRAQGLQVLVGLIGAGREVRLGERDVVQGHQVPGPVDVGLRSEPDDAKLLLRRGCVLHRDRHASR